MSEDPCVPTPTPTNYQRTTGGNLRWQPPTPEHLQEMLPAYEIMTILGQGGMGAVYKGRQKSLDRIVAIKILPPEAAADDMQFVERFKNEARTMAKMNHPAIVHVYDFGETSEGQLYIVMEFIDGTDVAKMIQSQGKLPEDYALSITAHVCDALGYAHKNGVVHRDIKPANVLINMEGQIKVADFGLAKATDSSQMGLTKTNMAMGTPDFVSPEALMPGVPLDGRADLYAVGVMLYNMLTGTIPRGAFRMPSATLKTDARFDAIILKSMEMDRELRYQTALDLRRDLDVILTAPQVKSGGSAQAAVPQQSLPQKPMGKSPSAPQQRKEAAPTAKPASKPAAAPAPAKKSNAAMIYGIAAAVVVIVAAAFMFSGGGKKAVTAAKPATPAKTQPQPPPPKPGTTPSPKPATAATKTAAPAVKNGEKWVDGLAQWFGGTKTNEAFARKPGEAVRVGKHASMLPLPPSAPLMRDMAVRATVRLGDAKETSGCVLSARSTLNASGKLSSYNVKLDTEQPRVRLGFYLPGKNYQGFIDYKLSADFDFTAPHTLELRVVGDLLTVTLDGRKLGERRDTQVSAGHPALAGNKAWIESFEYLNLDSGNAAPAIAATPRSDGILTFGGHRYHLVPEKLSWNAARSKAAAMGGHLATITTQEENEWMKKNIAGVGHVFLGGFREEKNGPWSWITGEAFDSELWGKNGPDGSGSKLSYIPGSKNWDDLSGDADFFLVEWDDDAPAKPAPVANAAPETSTPAPAPAMPAATPAPAPAVPAAPEDPRLAQLAAGYQARYDADVQKPYLAALAVLNQSYLANGITRARAAAQAKGSLSEVTAFDVEKAAIENGEGVPATDAETIPAALKDLRATYRLALAKITTERDAKTAPLLDVYLKALDADVAGLTKAGKIEEAKQLYAQRQEIAARREALSVPGAAAAPADAKPLPKDGFTNSLGMKFLPVKGTDVMFCIHETRRQDYATYAAANPGTAENWKNADHDGVPCGHEDNHPVVGIRWVDAQAFCAWLSEKEGKTYRLPTDEEWSTAVGISRLETRSKGITPSMLSDQERETYPWSGKYPPKSTDQAGNYADLALGAKSQSLGFISGYNDGFPTTSPVMSFKPNKLGLFDMGGNVLEWVEDWYDESQTVRVLRGGSFIDSSTNLLSSHRFFDGPNLGRHFNGFRIVLEAPKKAP